MTELQVPDFGALLAPSLRQVPPPAVPRFLALLERGAADRYRHWATLLPAHADVLLECAASEDEIADLIEAAFAVDADVLPVLAALLPDARDTYLQAFEGHPVWDQLRIQADAERQGANAWRGVAARTTDPSTLEALAACSALEEASGDRLDRLIAASGE